MQLTGKAYMSYSLNSLKGGYAVYVGGIIGVFKGDTRSLDYIAHMVRRLACLECRV